MKKVLQLPAFRRLLLATVFNELAWWIGSVSLALLIYRRTGSALGATAFFLCSQFGPALLSPFVVLLLDRQVPRRVIAELYAAEGLIFGALAWLVGHFSVALMLALVLFDGALFTTARVLTRAAWSSVTSPLGLLPEANAIFSGSLSVCYMAGPPIAGVLAAVGGTRTALLVNVGMFALVALLIATFRGLPPAVPTDHPTGFRGIGEGFRYMKREPMIRRLFGLQAAAIIFFAISIPVEIVLVRHTLHAGATWYGVLLAAWGVGTVAGSAFYARWRRLPSHILLALGATSLGVGFLIMALAPTIVVAVVGAAIAGIGNGSQLVAFRTALQERTDEQWMSMMLSLNESLFLAGPGLGIIIGGVVTALSGPRVALAVGSAGSLVAAAVMSVRLRPPASGVEREMRPTTTVPPLTHAGQNNRATTEPH